jgi:hypothetical protein
MGASGKQERLKNAPLIPTVKNDRDSSLKEKIVSLHTGP